MVIGLTGGIGSGKSTVAHLFGLLGAAVFHADIVAKTVYFDPLVRPKVIDLLGSQSYLGENEIDRRYISSRIFNNTSLLKDLNAIIHPAVAGKFEAFKKSHEGRLVIKESALLFEAGLQDQVDKIITVAADEELRIARIVERDGLGRKEVLLKIQSQLPQEEKVRRSDFIIDNNGTRFVIPQVLTIFNLLNHKAILNS